MLKKQKIDLSQFTDDEKKVINLLRKVEKCMYGNIFKELNMPSTTGAEVILSLTNKGIIDTVGRTSYYELSIKLEEH